MLWSGVTDKVSPARLLRRKWTGGAAPAETAKTPNVPVEEPALAVTWADPPGPMVADVAEMVPVAPFEAAERLNVNTPPATGSTGFLAVTVTARGLLNWLPKKTPCGVLPATAARVNPWLWKAPMSGSPPMGSLR